MNCLYFRQFAMVIRVPMGMVESGGIESADSGFGAALFRACASAGDITHMTITAETPSTPAIRAVDMANLFRAIIGLHLPSYSPTRSGHFTLRRGQTHRPSRRATARNACARSAPPSAAPLFRRDDLPRV